MKYGPVTRKTFPVSLLLEGKRCLIVGGGPGIARKIENLAASGGELTLVSPVLCERVQELQKRDLFFWKEREFRFSDLDDRDLVYCGTSDSTLNRSILDECRKRRILCCPIDSNWPDGDFTTPAIFRDDELSIAVSTGGASCRRSKLIKQNLEKHIEMIDSLGLLVIGTSHRELDLEKRESFHLGSGSFEAAGQMLSRVWGVHEFLILNTCNRVEIHAVVSGDSGVSMLLKRIMGFDTLKDDEFYLLEGEKAFEHTSTMMAGLYSQTPGENHIVAQMKDAYKEAEEAGWTGTILNDWFSRSLGVSKKIRNRIAPLLKEFEIEDVACENISQFLTDRSAEKDLALKGRTALILGTGIIAEGMARRLNALGFRLICCYHRNRPSWESEWEMKMISLDNFKSALSEADVVVAATSSPNYLLGPGDEKLFSEEGSSLLIDLSLPRNISPRIGRGYSKGYECSDEDDDASSGITVRDLDDLKHWYRRELADMERIMGECGSIIQENKDSYERIANSLTGGKPKQPAGRASGSLGP